jgi:hypothetical protein
MNYSRLENIAESSPMQISIVQTHTRAWLNDFIRTLLRFIALQLLSQTRLHHSCFAEISSKRLHPELSCSFLHNLEPFDVFLLINLTRLP